MGINIRYAHVLDELIENQLTQYNLITNGHYPPFDAESELSNIIIKNGYSMKSDDVQYLIYLLKKFQPKIEPSAYMFNGILLALNQYSKPFLMNGGFKKLIEEDEKGEYFKEQIIQVNNSVIETNKSVRKTNTKTLVIASLAAIFSLVSLVQQFIKSNEVQVQELKETNRLLQKTVQQLDSLQEGKYR